MTVTPDQCKQNRTADRLEAYINLIDAHLLLDSNGGWYSVFYVHLYVSKDYRDEIQLHYEKAGWNVSFETLPMTDINVIKFTEDKYNA